jgi:hypothetical protein
MINDFLLASKYRKLEILIIFLVGNENDCKLGYILYDVLRMKDKSDISTDIYNSLHSVLKVKLDNTEELIKDEEEKLIKISSDEISYERRINMLNISNNIKSKAIEKLKATKNNFQGDNKAISWLDGFLQIPFGIYCENEIMSFKKKYVEKLKNTYPSIIQDN